MQTSNVKKEKNFNTSFLTKNGIRKPKYIFTGIDDFGNEVKEITKKACITAIQRNNRCFSKNPNLLTIN